MTVATQQVKQQYQGNGTTTVFAIPYPLVTPGNLSVTLYDSVNFVNVLPNPVLNGRGTYDFTFWGKLDTAGRNQYVSQNQITFNNPPPANFRITIIRGEPYLQDLSLSNSVFAPATMEGAGFDNAIFQTEQLLQLLSQCVQAPVSDTAPMAILPPQELRANATFAFDENGNPIAIGGANFVESWNGRIGDVTLQPSDISDVGGALLASPGFTGVPTAPTASPGTSSTQLATCAFVEGLLTSPAFTGVPTAPTASLGTNTAQIATCAFVMNQIAAISAGVTTWNTRTGNVVLQASDVTAVGGALLASPTFTGTPAAPTATAGTNSTQIATTAFVAAAVPAGSSAAPVMDGTAAAGSSPTWSHGDHVHPTDTSRAPIASPTFTGTPAAPTATTGTNTTQLATCAFVQNTVSAVSSGVTTWNTRSGAVTLQAADVTGVGGALLASPTFTGTPAAPTATAGTNTTQLATCAFVQSAVGNYLLLTGGTLSGALSVNANLGVTGVSYVTGVGSNDANFVLTAPGVRAWTFGAAHSNGEFYIIDSTAPATRLTIDTSGNVSIPSGGLWITQSVAGPPLNMASAAGADDCNISMTAPGVRNWLVGVQGNSGDFYIYDASGGSTSIWITPSGPINCGGAEIETTGRLQSGIVNNSYLGSTACDWAIGWDGGNAAVQMANPSGINWLIWSNINAQPNWYPASQINIAGGGTTMQANSTGGGAAQWGTVWYSDRRTKRNIRHSRDDALWKVLTTTVYEADYTPRHFAHPDHPTQHFDHSWMADEVEKICPQAIVINPDDPERLQSLNTQYLVPILWQAVQELSAKVTALETARRR